MLIKIILVSFVILIKKIKKKTIFLFITFFFYIKKFTDLVNWQENFHLLNKFLNEKKKSVKKEKRERKRSIVTCCRE